MCGLTNMTYGRRIGNEMNRYIISDYNKYMHKVTCTIYANTLEEAQRLFQKELRASENI